MGKLIEWKQEFNTGCIEIDKQHQHLAEIINELYNAFEMGLAESKVIEVLEDLEEYTKTHFALEEELFEKYNYPLAQEHKEEHERLVKHLTELKENYYKNSSSLLSYEVMIMLKDWLLEHILVSDHKYKDFLCK